MPYNTESYYNHNKRQLIISMVILCFVLVFPAFLDFKGYSTTGTPAFADAEHAASVTPPAASEEIRRLVTSGRSYNLRGDHLQALRLYQEAGELAVANKLSAEQCMVLLYTGEILYKKGEYQRALGFFGEANSIAQKNNFASLQALALFYLGKYYHTTGNFELAREYYLRSVAISRGNHDKRQLAFSLPSLGKSYINAGKPDLALKVYQEAFYLSREINDPMLSADACNHIGGLYIELRNYEKAMEFHRKALQYRMIFNYPGELAKSYNNIGKVFSALNNYDSAGYYYERSLELSKQANYKKGQVKAMTHLGELYTRTGHHDKSGQLLREAFGIAGRIHYEHGLAEAAVDLGDMYHAIGKRDSALYYYHFSLDKLRKSNYNEELLRALRGLYTCYLGKQDYKTALSYHEDMLNTEKKLLDVENQRQLALLNLTFDTERKERDYQQLEKDNQLNASELKSKNTFIWLIITLLCFTILLCLYFYNRFYFRKKAHQKLKSLNAQLRERNEGFEKLNRELGQANREKDKLFSIIAHELRNPLFWLQNLTETLSRKHQSMPPEKIHKTLLSLDESARNVYHLMDNLLHWSRSRLNRVHPLKADHELHVLVGDTALMFDGFLRQKGIGFQNALPSGITVHADADLLSCVVRNLLSNAIKYTPRGGSIRIFCQISDEQILVTVADSGKGFLPEQIEVHSLSTPGLMEEKGSGLGLKLCREFVEMNGGSMQVNSQPGQGTEVTFTVPLSAATISQMENAEVLSL